MEPIRDVETDVLVVGGGLLGCAVAYYLARAGTDVVVIERDELNTQASGTNAGNLHAQIPHSFFTGEEEEYGDGRADLRAEMGRMRPLLLAAIEEWKELDRTMARDFGIDLEVAITGGLMVAETDAQMRVLEEKVVFERQFGLEAEIIRGNELRERAPYVSEHMIGAEYCPSEGTANPLVAAPALARGAEAAGARIFRQTALAGLECAPQGFEATTSRGRIRAGKVFAAAGGWIGEVAAMLGVDVRTRRDPIQIIVTEPARRTADHLIYFADQRLTMKQTRSGELRDRRRLAGALARRDGAAGQPRLPSRLQRLGGEARGAGAGPSSHHSHLGRRLAGDGPRHPGARRSGVGAGVLRRPVPLFRIHGRPLLRAHGRGHDQRPGAGLRSVALRHRPPRRRKLTSRVGAHTVAQALSPERHLR